MMTHDSVKLMTENGSQIPKSQSLIWPEVCDLINMTNILTTSCLTSNTHTHPFNGPFTGTTQVSRYLKRKTSLDFTEARDSEWQWHQLGHMQVCISLQTDNHASTPVVFYRPDALPATQPTASKHWRRVSVVNAEKVKIFSIQSLAVIIPP